MPTPIKASQHRNLIAQLQRDNRECNRKVSLLLEIIEHQSQIIADAVVVIELHDNEHVDLQVLALDLEESISVTNEKLINL
jgi:hypothetical protein